MRAAILFGFLLTSGSVFAEPAEFEPLRKATDEAMTRLEKDNLLGVVDALKPFMKSPEDRTQTLQTWTKNREGFTEKFGKQLGETEYIRTEVIGKSFVRFIYLEKFERHAIAWYFVFYRSGKEWRVHTASWSELPSPLFEPIK